MRYEVWCKSGNQDVLAYQSDVECDTRIIVDGVEVYHLTGVPQFAEPPGPGMAGAVSGYSVTAAYTNDEGQPVTVLEQEWSS